MLKLTNQQVLNVCRAILLKFTKQQVLTVRRSTGAKLHEHLREFFLRQMLLFWWFFGTFAGKSPVFVAELVVLWNICGNFPSVCCCFGGFVEHFPEDCRTFVAVFIGGVRVVKSPEFLVE